VATYATADELAEYVADSVAVDMPDDADAIERLLQRAERSVDAVLGPHELQPDGLKLDPSALTAVQSAALSRATCAAAEFEVLMGIDTLAGAETFIPAQLAVLRRSATTAPKVVGELIGTGLVTRSGCAAPTPAPEPDDATSGGGAELAREGCRASVRPAARRSGGGRFSASAAAPMSLAYEERDGLRVLIDRAVRSRFERPRAPREHVGVAERLLEAFREHGAPMTKAEAAMRARVRKGTARSVMQELARRGLVECVGAAADDPRAKLYALAGESAAGCRPVELLSSHMTCPTPLT
jgi:hypothetical protein